MHPIAPLKGGDENGWHPADDDSDVWNHGKHNHHCPDQGRKIQAEQCQGSANENAINQTDQQLTAEVRDNIRVDLEYYRRHFVLQRRRSQRQVVCPSLLNSRLFLEQKK